MKVKILICLLPAYVAAIVVLACTAIATDNGNEMTITKDDQIALITAVCDRLDKVYIYPERVADIRKYLYKNIEDGLYKKCVMPRDFAFQLDKDIQYITNDKHMGIVLDPKAAAEMKTLQPGSYYTPQMIDEYRQNNFGFKELQILPGNIGYMDLREFCPANYAGETAVAAMNYFANCCALIIDLRYNGGGTDDMVQLLLSYFFESADSTIIFSTSYSRYTNTYFQSSTFPYVPGRRLSKTPLYLLISKSTFSAAEAFAFNLKTLKRAIIVGENTRGGENPVEIQVIDNDYVIYISSWKLLSSISSTGNRWEGVGIKPDMEIDAAQALTAAHIAALEMLSGKTDDENKKSKYQWAMVAIRAKANSVIIDKNTLQSYVGTYRDKRISIVNNELHYQRGERMKMRMIPIAEDYFMIENVDSLRMKFIQENGTVTGAELFYDDGRVVKENKGDTIQ